MSNIRAPLVQGAADVTAIVSRADDCIQKKEKTKKENDVHHVDEAADEGPDVELERPVGTVELLERAYGTMRECGRFGRRRGLFWRENEDQLVLTSCQECVGRRERSRSPCMVGRQQSIVRR